MSLYVSRRNLLAGLGFLAMTTLLAPTLPANAAGSGYVMTNADGIAINGYDPVAYFTDQAAVLGDPAITTEWEGAVWHFASAEHRDLFLADPAKYAPQYGGWCAYGAGEGYAAEADPKDAWTIYEGKLFLNWDATVMADWRKDIPGRTEKSEAQWPVIQQGLGDGTATVYRKEP